MKKDSDRGRKYQTFDKSLKTKTEIRAQAWWGYKNRPEYKDRDLSSISEDMFFKMTSKELSEYFFGEDVL